MTVKRETSFRVPPTVSIRRLDPDNANSSWANDDLFLSYFLIRSRQDTIYIPFGHNVNVCVKPCPFDCHGNTGTSRSGTKANARERIMHRQCDDLFLIF